MTTKHTSEPNKFIALRKAITSLGKDIAFLTKCKASNITPRSHQIKIKTSINFNKIRKIENEIITHSIKALRTKLDKKTLEAYHLHLKLAQLYPREFPLFLTKVKVAERCESERKRKIHSKKFRNLIKEQKPKKHSTEQVQKIENFVVNQSSQTFTPKQLDLLDNGLNYATYGKPNIQGLIIDLEAGINTYSSTSTITAEQKEFIRTTTKKVIKQNLASTTGTSNLKEKKIAKELSEKPVYYVKADKGNALGS